MKLDTLFVHAGARPDPGTGAVAPPIHLSTTYARDEKSELIGPSGYIREGSPTQTLLEDALAPIEGGERALVFSSGMAAATALLQTLSSGDHVVLPDDAYYGLSVAAADFLPGWGIRTDRVGMDDLSALERAIRPATQAHLARVAFQSAPEGHRPRRRDRDRAAKPGIRTVVDNTFATPALQRPILLGADVVMHSMTKYIGGHSDLQGGALVFARSNDGLRERVEHARHILGGVASPFNSWLALRGLRTLPVRMERHSANALAVARALEANPGRLRRPLSRPRRRTPATPSRAARCPRSAACSRFGCAPGATPRSPRSARVGLFTRATSLGAVESLIEHRATSEGPASRTPPELIRLSVGLEHPDDLVEDLRQALAG